MRLFPNHLPMSVRRRRPALLAAASVTLLALAAAGCGSGGTSTGAPASGTTTPPSAATGQQTTAVPPPSTSGPPQPAPSTTAASSPGAQQNAAGARCTVTELRMGLGTGDPGAGNIYYPLRFTNISGRTCTLDGFPGVSLIRGDGSVIGRPADRRGPQGAVVSIAPGKTVQADLHTLNQGVKGDACWRKPTFLMAYPPGSKDSMTLATASPVVCGDTFDVSPVH